MVSVKEHYKNHLAPVYSWMCGDFSQRKKEFETLIREHSLLPKTMGLAIDLGAGHGIQTLALAECGYEVTAVDFDGQLLSELGKNAEGFPVTTVQADTRDVLKFQYLKPELIVCCGDTLAHLETKKEVQDFIQDVASILPAYGKLLLTFRDYSIALEGNNRFIHVKSDDHFILTCFLEYSHDSVQVTDILYQKNAKGWEQSQSTYRKVRLLANEVVQIIGENRLHISYLGSFNRMVAIIAEKSA